MMAPSTTCLLLVTVLITVAECRPYSFFDLLFPSQQYDGVQQTRRQAEEYGTRGSRQTSYGTSASQFIDSIFQVPIQTLNSVGQLVKTTVDLPGFQRRREQRLDSSGSRGRPSGRARNKTYLSQAAQTANLPVADDGSSYKI